MLASERSPPNKSLPPAEKSLTGQLQEGDLSGTREGGTYVPDAPLPLWLGGP